MKDTVVFVLDRKAINETTAAVAKDYPILYSLSWGEREEVYEAVRLHMRTTWRVEVADILEMFAVELEDREHRPSRGGR